MLKRMGTELPAISSVSIVYIDNMIRMKWLIIELVLEEIPEWEKFLFKYSWKIMTNGR
jgi:hypothetical protein